MLAVFMAGFLGIVAGTVLVCILFHQAYLKERALALEASEKLYKLVSGEAKATKNGSVLSLFKTDKDTPLN
jgi:hypothetical protein